MIVEQRYWDDAYRSVTLQGPAADDPVKKLIDRFVPMATEGQTAFEAGCFPGRYLLEVGAKGYVLNGCDLTPRVEELRRWLDTHGIPVGRIRHGDFADESRSSAYDLVCSFGFIEHFADYPDVFLHHCDLVKPGGLLVVEFPNFFGFWQRLLHRFLDRDNHANHVIDAMDVNRYTDLLPASFELIYGGYFGGFDFWVDDYKKSNGRLRRQLIKMLMKTRPFWVHAADHERHSPYGAIVARRKRA